LYVLIFAGLAIIVQACGRGPTPTEAPALTPLEVEAGGTLMFLEGNNCMEDVVGEMSDMHGQRINLKQENSFKNDEARSLVLLNVQGGSRLTIFDSPEGNRDDDWTEIFIKKEFDVYCVGTFEQNYEDEVVQVVFHQVNGLDGKVSRIEIDFSSYVAMPTAKSEPTNTSTTEPTSTETSVPTSTIIPLPTMPAISVAQCIPTGTTREVASVVYVVDGDTIDVSIEGVSFRVRYIGIDTPETDEPYFQEATSKNAGFVQGQTVTLVKDMSETDQYGRILRYVLVGDTFANYELVRQGYAMASTYPPDVACSEFFAQAQNTAATEGAGLWAATPTPFPTSPPPTKANCDPSYPTVCIPPYPPDLDCKDITYRRFKVLPPDPHGFDGDDDGIGCESG